MNFLHVGKVGLIGALCIGLIGSPEVRAAGTEEVILAASATVFGFLAISSLIAIKQDKQHELKNSSLFKKVINWYRRVICGKVAKKQKQLQPDGKTIKNIYTESSGVFGTALSIYDTHNKDIKKAFGFAAIPALLITGNLKLITSIPALLASFAKGAPGGEFVTT